jgi:outer membrane biosynthesis protein TonB
MRRGLAWLGGALGLAALWRYLQQESHAPPPVVEPAPDPAAELRAKLEEAREAADDRDDYDAAEGQPVDQAEPREPEPEPEPEAESEPEPEPEPEPGETRSLEERRRAIHEKAQEALGEMQRPADQ